jgi:hypothetical protein
MLPPVMQTSPSACSAELNWQKPYECNATIKEYKVEVKDSNGTFHRVPTCGSDPEKQSCTVGMETFTGSGFSLA